VSRRRTFEYRETGSPGLVLNVVGCHEQMAVQTHRRGY
jgi:hypothetical protein